jgi:hypothetical protein
MSAGWANIPGPFLGSSSVNMFPLLGSRFLIVQQLGYNNGNGVFLQCPYQDVISKGQSQLIVSFVWESVKRRLEPEAE